MRKRPLSQLALPIILIFCSCFAFANSKVDSLKQLLNKSIQDTSRLSILFELNKAFGKEKDSSLYYLNRAYELAEATNQPDAQIKALLDMGLIYHNRQAYPEAKTRLLKALSLARQYKLENRLPYVYLDLGNTYRRLMKTDSAIYAYQQSIKNFEKIEETYDTWKPIFNIGRVYMVLEDIERAKNYMTRAFAIVKDSDNRMDRGYLIFFLAELYRKLEDFDGYFDMLQEWERFQKEKNKNEVQLNEFAHLTMFAMFTKDDSLVIKNYRDAIDYFKEKANYFRLGWSYHDLGQIHFNRENYDTAQSLFQKALENFQLNQNTERIAGTLLKLYQTEKVLNNFPQALSYLEQHEALKDSLNLHEMKQHMARLEVEFETEKKEQRLALQALDIRQKTAQRNLFLGSSLLLAILALTIFFALRNRIRLNRKISNQEAAL